MGGTNEASLQGDLHIYPPGIEQREAIVASHYDELLEDYELKSILCVTRLCSDQDLIDEILDTFDGVRYPSVTSLQDLATETLQTLCPRIEFLSDNERIELLAAFLEQHDWETTYLHAAADRESFQQDVGQLLIEMESRDGLTPGRYESPILQEIAAVGSEFQSLLADQDYVDRPSLIPKATAKLRAASTENSVPASLAQADVVIVADFEEFARSERRFLDAVSDSADASIVAIAEEQSRILSSWRETGDVASMAGGLDIQRETAVARSMNRPQAAGQYFVTGQTPDEPIDEGVVEVIEASTFRAQITAVANEIERLCRSENYQYEDVTIAYQDSSAPLEQTIRLLRRHGIPTTTVAVSQMGNDPAVRELFDVTRVCAETESEEARAAIRERLLTLEGVSESLIEDIRRAETAESGLWQWLAATQLKDRIGREWTDISARDQYQHIQEVLDLAAFRAAEPHLDGSWASFVTTLERAFRYSSSRLEHIDTDHDDGGVPIGTIYGLKHSPSKAVFLLNVTDQDYPFTPSLTPLLPFKRLREESNFPMLTTQTPSDVTETFDPGVGIDERADSFHAYFTQVSRRLLGISARSASERLYFGIPLEGTDSLGTYNQPSRFLSELVGTFEWITPLADGDEAAITSHGGASEFIIERVDDTLEAARRASVGSDTVDLDAYEQELAAIEGMLDTPAASTVQEALEARVDFRHGRVRRD